MRCILLAAVFLCLTAVARADDAPTARHAENTTVTQSHTAFGTNAVTLKAGDSITFNNRDEVTHDVQVTNSDGDVDDEGLQRPGQDVKVTFAKPGTYTLHCAIHPGMKMKVTVN